MRFFRWISLPLTVLILTLHLPGIAEAAGTASIQVTNNYPFPITVNLTTALGVVTPFVAPPYSSTPVTIPVCAPDFFAGVTVFAGAFVPVGTLAGPGYLPLIAFVNVVGPSGGFYAVDVY